MVYEQLVAKVARAIVDAMARQEVFPGNYVGDVTDLEDTSFDGHFDMLEAARKATDIALVWGGVTTFTTAADLKAKGVEVS